MADTVLEDLKKTLDSEEDAPALQKLPRDFYYRISRYTQKIKRSAGANSSEVANRLIVRQVDMIDSMTRELIALRAKKAIQKHTSFELLPEERYVWSLREKSEKRLSAFVEAVSAGQPSFIEFAQKSVTERSVIVKFIKHVDELVGLDLRRYGPFEVEDIASLPAANAEILIVGGSAVESYPRDTDS